LEGLSSPVPTVATGLV